MATIIPTSSISSRFSALTFSSSQSQSLSTSSSLTTPNPNPNPNPNLSPNHTLTPQQQQILTSVTSGHSIFITGSAGTGKTHLLTIIIRILKCIHNPSSIFVTASTGIAACSLSGQTLHSFAGIGLGTGDLRSLLSKIYKNKQACWRWKSCKALVIDEISMVDGELFDMLENIARKMRPWAAHLPWGGIQLIVCGDFFQLPPVNNNNVIKEFAFEADCWDSSFRMQVELTRIFRQSDSELIDVLQALRRGEYKDKNLQRVVRKCSVGSNDECIDGVTRLFPRNEDVRKLNAERLASLRRYIFNYKAIDKGKSPWKAQLKQALAPQELEICEGARVMLIRNTDVSNGLINGATGTVTGFVSDDKNKVKKMCSGSVKVLPRVRFDTGAELVVTPEKWTIMEGENVRATRKQIPLILAWALSVHKCQGMTLDRLHTDLSRAFGCGMVYVALSRVRSLAGLRLSGFNPYKIKAHPKVLHFYERFLLSKSLN